MNLGWVRCAAFSTGGDLADNRRRTGLSREWGDDHVSVGFEMSKGDCDAAALDV